jgi:hypothetical protein
MKKLLIVLMTIVVIPVFGQQEDVKTAFSDYKTAMVSNDIQGVLDITSKNSFEYYEMLIDYALNADSAEVAGLSFMDRMSVLGTRIQIPKDKLVGMDGASYVRYGLENGLTNSAALNAIDVGEVTLEGDNKAQAQVTYMSQPLPAQMTFVQEGGKWKFDATSMLKFSEDMILQQIGGMGVSENEFIIQALTQAAGGSLSEDIWQPLMK